MEISLKIMLLDVHKCFYIELLCKKITSMIRTYFAAVANYNLAHKEL